MIVEIAAAIGDSSLSRPWSKYSAGSSANEKFNAELRIKKETEKLKKKEPTIETNNNLKKKEFTEEENKKLNEFLQVMQPRSKSKTWANDDNKIEIKNSKIEKSVKLNTNDVANDYSEEKEDMFSYDIAKDEKISDVDYLKSRMKSFDSEHTVKNVSTVAEKFGEATLVSVLEEPQNTPKEIPAEDLIGETGRLLVNNLAYSATTQEVEQLFSVYGPVAEVHIPIDKLTKNSKGYGFVLFLIPENAVKAYSALDGSIFQGRLLKIIPAREKVLPEDEDDAKISFKDKKEKQLRKASMKNEGNWNSLFMNSDAVANAMAAKLGVKKSEILDPASENMAVRLALSETQIINETKEYLQEQGVCLDAFQSNRERSDTCILVKNIPFTTTVSDIENLFGNYGTLGRCVIPPTKTVALVEFLEANEAKAAFKRLAYTKYKSLPLYLEWAPTGAFNSKFESTKKKNEIAITNGTTSDLLLDDTKDDPDMMPVATLFVKNLNFSTTEQQLKEAFSSLQGLTSTRVATKPDKKDSSKKLSMGFGFVEFNSKENAVNALKAMQGFNLNGHVMQIKFSNASIKSSSGENGKGNKKGEIKVKGTKLIIRNIPFEATKQDIKQLFRSFGQVKALRIPTKIDGSHRGFGFIDFLTQQEAKAAFEAVSSTHLYGRHLVLEWAKDDDSVDAIREKTRKNFNSNEIEEDKRKKRKVVLGNDEDSAMGGIEDD
ncbi:hypothetical protein HK099_004023 [Clydaea vesicula]|uniref:RRM domain-containing protein n=1 Tax=Clydaea vesicula TaxID=447962 RepID=A0AAD5U0X7_9FUNG|nr:hypothetical protein HK099_004023 [Clydaea vesicula]